MSVWRKVLSSRLENALFREMNSSLPKQNRSPKLQVSSSFQFLHVRLVSPSAVLVAMTVEDDIWQDIIISQGNQKSDSLSAEDVAWVDSCLIQDSELLDSSWSSLTEALLDILASQTSSYDAFPANVSSNASEGKVDNAVNIEYSQTSSSDALPVNGCGNATEGRVDNPLSIEEFEESEEGEGEGQICIRNDFHFKALDFTENERAEVGGFWEEPVENVDSSGDVFRVWDLQLPSEEDEFIKQLNKALAESSSRTNVGTSSDNTFDDIITSMADLSLQSSD